MSTEITQTTGQAGEPQESTRGVPSIARWRTSATLAKVWC